jgi:hypothetical protein
MRCSPVNAVQLTCICLTCLEGVPSQGWLKMTLACSAGLTHLSALTALVNLNVAYTAAGDAALLAWTSLTNLRTLNLDSCSISDRSGLIRCHMTAVSQATLACVRPSSASG